MQVRHVVGGLDHPECITVDSHGNLFCGGEDGQIYAISDQRSEANQIASHGGLILGLCVNGNGTIYACDASGKNVFARTLDGGIRDISSGYPDRPMSIPNFPVLDEKGNLFVSDSGSWPEGGGCIYKISPDGTCAVWSEAAPRFTNGLAIHPSGEFLYVAESLLPGVSRISILPDGSAGECETVCLMPGTVPDGLAFDVEESLYISCYRPDRVYRLKFPGELEVLVDDFQGTDVAAPTNIVFAGESKSTLYLASLARWHIAALDMEISGAPLHYPDNSFEGRG